MSPLLPPAFIHLRKIEFPFAIVAPVIVLDKTVGVVTPIASVNPKGLTAFVSAPVAGTMLLEELFHVKFTAGLLEPFFHTSAVYTTRKDVIVAPVEFNKDNVALPLVALLDPKNEMLLLPYHPPEVPVAWAVPLKLFPVDPLPANDQLGILLPLEVPEYPVIDSRIFELKLVIVAEPDADIWAFNLPLESKTTNEKIVVSAFVISLLLVKLNIKKIG